MFELKYKITDADFKAVNKSIMWQYFIPYMLVALLGLAAGIAAVTFRPQTEMLVLGIILIVLAGILLVCAVLMAITPKSFVASALLTDDSIERSIEIGENAIIIKTPEKDDIIVRYDEIYRVKAKKNYALLYVDKDAVVLVKDEIVSGGSFAELCELLKSKVQKRTASAEAVNPETPEAQDVAPKAEPEISEESKEEASE